MSWEDSEPQYRSCPCGKGRYSVVYRSDDWGRSDERWAMHCEHCSETHGLYSYNINRKGIDETYYGWLPESGLAEILRLNKKISHEERTLATYLKAVHAIGWHRHFNGKTKKAIWRELTDDGSDYPSLSTFYDHVRRSGLDQILGSYLTYSHIKTLIRILQPKDTKLSAQVKAVKRLKRSLEEKSVRARQESFT